MKPHSTPPHELRAQVIAYGAEFLDAHSREELLALASEGVGRLATHAAYDHFAQHYNRES